MSKLPEYWLRGPIDSVPSLLQPVAHALLQAREEVVEMMKDVPNDRLWWTPSGLASVAFHLQHLTGVLDRLFTYAKGSALDTTQLEYLALEGKEVEGASMEKMIQAFVEQVDKSVRELAAFETTTLTATRVVGRKQLPSTVIGLLFHAAEHTMRHTGQLLVTVRWVKSGI